MPQPLVSLSTDFGPGNKGIGVMHGVVLEICPQAVVIDLVHDITGLDIREGAKLFEAAAWLRVGHHVCVVDPGVGTDRRGIVIETGRGDRLIGPDNGVLIPATRFLGGITAAYHITNPALMLPTVSATFHGRDVFAPVAAHLAAGVPIAQVGPEIFAAESPCSPLHSATYEEAVAKNGTIDTEIVCINRFGSVFLNVCAAEMHAIAKPGDVISMQSARATITVPYDRTFGDVEIGEDVIMDDDFGRVQAAVNQGSFAGKHKVRVGDRVKLSKK